MYSWKIDIPVLLIFFAREETLRKVFEQIKEARPRILFLYQDGPRGNRESDIEGIKKCREYIEGNIDWDCEVHKLYQEKNVGCDPSEFIAQKWAFSLVDKCIVLEDDDVPSQAFFSYCKEMLDLYEFDDRINIISGQNILGNYAPDNDRYFFSSICAIWGWATWKRVVDKWDDTYGFLDDKNTMRELNKRYRKNKHYRVTIKSAKAHKKTGIAFYETLVSTTMYLNNSLNIVPYKNLITNIGISEESTHSVSDIRMLPRGIRRVFNMQRYDEIEDYANANQEIAEDEQYREKVCRIMGWGYPLVTLWRKVESFFRYIKYQGLGAAVKKVKKHMQGIKKCKS